MASKIKQKKSQVDPKEPQYFENAQIICACGNTILTGSTVAKTQVEVCSLCHPFYTGSSKLIDTAGRVDKFRQRLAKASKSKMQKQSIKLNKKNSKADK